MLTRLLKNDAGRLVVDGCAMLSCLAGGGLALTYPGGSACAKRLKKVLGRRVWTPGGYSGARPILAEVVWANGVSAHPIEIPWVRAQ